MEKPFPSDSEGLYVLFGIPPLEMLLVLFFITLLSVFIF